MDYKNSVKIIEDAYLSHKNRYNSILDWTVSNPYKKYNKSQANKIEKNWGNAMIRMKDNNQWTTKLGEYIVSETLKKRGCNTWKPKMINHYRPDLETNNFIYEIKTRNWTTSGTAGEKVYGVPYKYSDIPRLYSKPLRIVCVAYQEYELTHGNSNVFGDKISKEKKEMLDFWKSKHIEFIPFTTILSDLNLLI